MSFDYFYYYNVFSISLSILMPTYPVPATAIFISFVIMGKAGRDAVPSRTLSSQTHPDTSGTPSPAEPFLWLPGEFQTLTLLSSCFALLKLYFFC